LKEDQREIKSSQLALSEMELLMTEWMGLEGKNFY